MFVFSVDFMLSHCLVTMLFHKVMFTSVFCLTGGLTS